MNDIRYTIEVFERTVEIFGRIPIDDLFDFIDQFKKKGFNEVIEGCEESTIRIFKNDLIKNKQDEQIEKNIYETFYEEEKKENESLKNRISQLESFFKLLLKCGEGDSDKNIKDLSEKLFEAAVDSELDSLKDDEY